RGYPRPRPATPSMKARMHVFVGPKFWVVGQFRLLRREGRNTHRLLSLHRPWLRANRRRLASPFFASLSCFTRKPGVRLPWRTRSPGRRSTGPSSRLTPVPLVAYDAPGIPPLSPAPCYVPSN
ncbi:MAG: hypothetical protein V3S33_00020, partial [Gammaproteobacteria bacterium]